MSTTFLMTKTKNLFPTKTSYGIYFKKTAASQYDGHGKTFQYDQDDYDNYLDLHDVSSDYQSLLKTNKLNGEYLMTTKQMFKHLDRAVIQKGVNGVLLKAYRFTLNL